MIKSLKLIGKLFNDHEYIILHVNFKRYYAKDALQN